MSPEEQIKQIARLMAELKVKRELAKSKTK